MKLDPSKISSVDGYSIIEIQGSYGVFEDDVRDGLRQIGPDFDTFQEAAEHALALGKTNLADELLFPQE